ncbi:hypothetical protein SAMN05444412_103251 [Rhodonellum ikkaensis]|uniref:Uncharacterized protein n=1 Tax=Rhodonellum ikkaensis TaxID=336829 RepID=A0A1H3NH67_9BACT|nr:hypothetical protein SAMN05444412_103251 [Rhodonellum ikkaensis]
MFGEEKFVPSQVTQDVFHDSHDFFNQKNRQWDSSLGIPLSIIFIIQDQSCFQMDGFCLHFSREVKVPLSM